MKEGRFELPTRSDANREAVCALPPGTGWGGKPHADTLGANPVGFCFQLWQTPSSFPAEDPQSKPCSGRGGCRWLWGQSPDVAQRRDQRAEVGEQGGLCPAPLPLPEMLWEHWSLQHCGQRMGQGCSWDQALTFLPWGLLLRLGASLKPNWGICQTAWLRGFIQVGLLLITLSYGLRKVCVWRVEAATSSALPRFYCACNFWAVISFNFQ